MDWEVVFRAGEPLKREREKQAEGRWEVRGIV